MKPSIADRHLCRQEGTYTSSALGLKLKIWKASTSERVARANIWCAYTYCLNKKQLLILWMVATVMHDNAFCKESKQLWTNVGTEASCFNLLRRPTGFLAYSITKEYKDVDSLATYDLIWGPGRLAICRADRSAEYVEGVETALQGDSRPRIFETEGLWLLPKIEYCRDLAPDAGLPSLETAKRRLQLRQWTHIYLVALSLSARWLDALWRLSVCAPPRGARPALLSLYAEIFEQQVLTWF